MNLSNCLDGLFDRIARKDIAAAWQSACIAVEATAKREFGAGGRSNYKRFVRENCALITKIGVGVGIERIRLKYSAPGIDVGADGTCPIEDVIYHAIRCGLVHDASIPANLELTPERIFSITPQKLVIPESLVDGLAMACLVSPANRDVKLSESRTIQIRGVPMSANKFAGRRAEIVWLLDAIESPMESGQLATEPINESSSGIVLPPHLPSPWVGP